MLVNIGGRDLRYDILGDEAAPVVCLAHALSSDSGIWAEQVGPLLAAGWRVLRPDMRGHGGSEAGPEDCTMRALAEDVVQILDFLRIGKVHFVGLSIGGMIGQTFALQYPERLSALALCSTGSRTGAQAKAGLEQRIQKAQTEGMESQVPLVLQNWFTDKFRETAPATTSWIAGMIRSTQVEGFVGCCRAIQGLDALDRLGAIRVPTLLVAGDQDKNFPPTVAEEIQQRIPGSELKVLSGAAHLGSVEQVHAFNEMVGEFLQRAVL